jgi:hypothetical protein
MLSDKIIDVVSKQPGITDRWLAEAIFGQGAPQQRVNGECRSLASQNKIVRRKRDDGLIGNFPLDENAKKQVLVVTVEPVIGVQSGLSEDRVKEILEKWLSRDGWSVKVAWARARGVDIDATRNNERWLIEVKGQGSLDAMRVNYFLAMLGELLQRMHDPTASYSIALPDLKQFRNLWSRLPTLAKQRTTITALFVSEDGSVELVK